MVNVKVFIKGGALAPTDLKKIVDVAFSLNTVHFQFGERQEIIFRIPDQGIPDLENLLKGYVYEVLRDGDYEQKNIVSSLLSSNILPSTYWVKDATYYDILDTLPKSLRLKVNITDLKQDLVYSFTGDINFVPSENTNYWHAYVRAPNEDFQQILPFTVHSENIAMLVEYLEVMLLDEQNSWDILIEKIKFKMGEKLLDSSMNPLVRVSEFFNYEGIHQYDDRKYWLGIYKRFTRFSYSELTAICQLCLQQRIGRIFITPWKSLLIKNIDVDMLTDWKFFLAYYNINNGHAQSELNWQLNNFDEDALELKAYLRKNFIRHDINSNAVILGINSKAAYSFSHILIKQRAAGLFKSYDVMYRNEFNPTCTKFVTYAQHVRKWKLRAILQELIGQYNNKAFKEFATFKAKTEKAKKIENTEKVVEQVILHQCPNCMTVYDKKYGDPHQHIGAGVSFAQLPEQYCCPMCETPKEKFIQIKESELVLQ